jgi:hypothetical protein
MLKRLMIAVAAVGLFAPLALAGDCAGSACGCDCANACPLAKEAARHKSTGGEAVLASKAVQKVYVATVLANVKSI